MKNRPTCSNCSPTGRDQWSIKCTTLASEIARASPIANVYGKIDELRQLRERSQQSAAAAVGEEEDDERVYWIAQRTPEWGNLSYRPAGLGSGFGLITCFKLFSSSSPCVVFFLPQSKIYRFTYKFLCETRRYSRAPWDSLLITALCDIMCEKIFCAIFKSLDT